jgi:hypothetical protein
MKTTNIFEASCGITNHEKDLIHCRSGRGGNYENPADLTTI